jgi:multidrug efflux pump subunit AcrB
MASPLPRYEKACAPSTCSSAARAERTNLADLRNLVLTTDTGASVPLAQVARLETRMEDAVLKRYDRETYIAVQGDIRDGTQPPDVTHAILPKLEQLKASLPAGYHIDTGGSVKKAPRPTRHWPSCSR